MLVLFRVSGNTFDEALHPRAQLHSSVTDKERLISFLAPVTKHAGTTATATHPVPCHLISQCELLGYGHLRRRTS